MLSSSYRDIRKYTEDLCRPLQTEDYVVQPIVDVSPPKWHLGHTTWFFETFILKDHLDGYQVFNENFNYVFNSYYESVGARVIRTNRGNLSRPTVQEVYQYRQYVDLAMEEIFKDADLAGEICDLLLIGLNHEQQHQELLLTDIKYILGHNPLFPPYEAQIPLKKPEPKGDQAGVLTISEGLYEIGYKGKEFCFDNELNNHFVFLKDFSISRGLISNGEYLEFINAGGYSNFKFWHSEGWEWAKNQYNPAPLYWHKIDGEWFNYTLTGLKPLDLEETLCHINFYEAHAFAEWRGKRLPTEFEWEVAADQLQWGERWEWTESAYLPYPGYKKADGAIGEYNGKFMVNQMVLRGASVATPKNHSRKTYRNFFHPDLKWQFTGIRLAE
ncbi:ergothioneine biosynthesis protein EgtB [Desertivirga brevis]|uniref:ergothioneine biosynthesis protein EgtB n=1 Tax=Desertivirga brevis TaxID=2810310 RepID=UPI001A97262C|nr:ergothioneine biosynthesis protein EgtB [Pedobacter sp. SYSU D00873]